MSIILSLQRESKRIVFHMIDELNVENNRFEGRPLQSS